MKGYPEEAQEHSEELQRQMIEEEQEWKENLAAQAEAEAETDIRYPICPLNMFFEGDDIYTDKCDYDPELRRCSARCVLDIPVLKRELQILSEAEEYDESRV